MRLSVAEKCAPDLAKSRAEVQRLKQSVLSLTRHNKSLMLELHRAQAAAQGVETVMSSEEAGVLAQAASQPSAVQWPASAVELIESNKKYEALRQEHRAQGKLLSEYRGAAVELEQRTVQANEAIAAMVRLRGELEPIVAQLKKDHAEDAIWDDVNKLHTTISAARTAGIPEHKVKHLVDRAEALDGGAPATRRKRDQAAAKRSSPRKGMARSTSQPSVAHRPDTHGATQPSSPQHEGSEGGSDVAALAPPGSARLSEAANTPDEEAAAPSSAEKLRSEVEASRPTAGPTAAETHELTPRAQQVVTEMVATALHHVLADLPKCVGTRL